MRTNRLAAIVGIGLVMTWRSYAGIPEPSIVLYGQVWNAQGSVVTSGTLVVTYMPSGGGTPVSVVVPLQASPGSGGTMQLSYILEIPCETGVSGSGVTDGALSLTAALVDYARSATLNGASLNFAPPASMTVSVSQNSRGQLERVDFGLGVTFDDINHDDIPDFWEQAHGFTLDVNNASGDPDHDGFTNLQEYLAGTDPNNANSTPSGISSGKHHSGDYSQPFNQFSLTEMLGMVDLFTSTITHDYHVDTADPRGYSAGLGSHDGAAHSVDYINGPDWKISLSELLRVIDLFSSNADHSYCVDPSSLEDGFTAFGCTGAKSALEPIDAAKLSDAVVINQSVNTDHAATDGLVDITIEVVSNADRPTSALGLVEHLPEGWVYQSLAVGTGTESTPKVTPHPGATGAIEFAWLPTPSGPVRFTFRVSAPKDKATEANVTGEGKLRFREASGEAVVVVTDAPIAAFAVRGAGLLVLAALVVLVSLLALRRKNHAGRTA